MQLYKRAVTVDVDGSFQVLEKHVVAVSRDEACTVLICIPVTDLQATS